MTQYIDKDTNITKGKILMNLIDKDAVVAEFRRRIQESIDAGGATRGVYLSERMKEDSYILSFIDTLEVKEVDLKEEIDKIWKPRFSLGWDDKSLLSVSYEGFEIIAKHFFELGLNTQKGE